MVSGRVMLDAKIEPPERNHFEIPPREKIPVWIKEEEKLTEVVLPMAAVGQGHRPLHRCLSFNYPSDALTSVSMRCATTSGCSTKLLFGSITSGIRISWSGQLALAQRRRLFPTAFPRGKKTLSCWHQYLDECPPDRGRNPRCFNGLPYRCRFPQITIVCQQIRGHTVRVLLEPAARREARRSVGYFIN